MKKLNKFLLFIVIVSANLLVSCKEYDTSEMFLFEADTGENIEWTEIFENAETQSLVYDGSKIKTISLSSLTNGEILSYLIMDTEGRNYSVDADDGYIQRDKDKINFISEDLSLRVPDIQGAIINPPDTSITDTYYTAVDYLEEDKDVLVIFLDGFSYSQYEYIKRNYPDLFISGIDAHKASSVFKPVTNAGFAAMITVTYPYENGILDRSFREIKNETIFDTVNNMGKSALLVEGAVKILNTESDLILNSDKNGDGLTDDEVFESAFESIKEYDFALVHFHGIDDEGHNSGPFGEETINRIVAVDNYVSQLVSCWRGMVIITADHGMHETSYGGDHGEFRYEDMIVPYAVMQGGQNEK